MCWTRVLKPQCCRALQPRCPCLWETGPEPGSVLLRLLLRSERLCESEIAENVVHRQTLGEELRCAFVCIDRRAARAPRV